MQTSQGQIRLSFVEENPTVGQRVLKAHVFLEGVEEFENVVIVFKNENENLEFLDWHQDPDYPSMTMCAPITRDGNDEIILGIVGRGVDASSIALGYFEAAVNVNEELELTDEDYGLVSAHLLASGTSQGPAMVLAMSGMQLVREYSPPVYVDDLAQNYPNPFNPTTTIAYSLAKRSDVQLVIFDVTGARVRTLVDGPRESNKYRVTWDGRDERGNSVASGVYFYRLIAGDFRATKKMVLLR